MPVSLKKQTISSLHKKGQSSAKQTIGPFFLSNQLFIDVVESFASAELANVS